MVNSKKVILISFSVKPVLRFQRFFWFLADVQLTKVPTPTQCKEFCDIAICTVSKLERLIRCHLLAISASKQVEWFYRAIQWTTKVLVASELRKIDFCGSNLPDGCPVRRFSSYKPSGKPLKKWLERNVVWSKDIISEEKWTYLCCIVL